ncbi:MAG: hypothetical protein KatS3mg087_1735 [Patescibacteria group bacterium]|nr:MAG: hypothetical protein KatS3mg087_1735 [Patescibacteria group bacterium]
MVSSSTDIFGRWVLFFTGSSHHEVQIEVDLDAVQELINEGIEFKFVQ